MIEKELFVLSPVLVVLIWRGVVDGLKFQGLKLIPYEKHSSVRPQQRFIKTAYLPPRGPGMDDD